MPETIYSTSMPKWGEPGYLKAIKAAGGSPGDPGIIDQAYKGYGWGVDNEPGTDDDTFSQRIAGFSDMQLAAMDARKLNFLAGDPTSDYSNTQMGEAEGALNRAEGMWQRNDYNPGDYYLGSTSGYYDPADIEGGIFGAEQASQYMNPYQQAVTDQALAAAREEYALSQQQSDAASVGRGSRGGHRADLMSQLGHRDFIGQMGDIQARGSAEAYANAQAQFNKDRASRIDVEKYGDDSRRFGMGLMNKDRDALFRLGDDAEAAEKMSMKARQENRDAEFSLAEKYASLAGTADSLGNSYQSRLDNRIREMQRAGSSQQELEQSVLDMLYNDFERQRDYPKENLNWFMNLLSGVPQEKREYISSPGPGLADELLGGAMLGQSLFGG